MSAPDNDDYSWSLTPEHDRLLLEFFAAALAEDEQ